MVFHISNRQPPSDSIPIRQGMLILSLLFLAAFPPAQSARADDSLASLPLRGLKANVAHLLFSAEEGGVLPVAVLAVPWVEESGSTVLALYVEIDGQGLLAHHRPPRLPVEVYAYVVTAEGTIAAHLAETVEMDPAESGGGRSTRGDTLAAGGLKLRGRLEVPPGDHRLRVLVRHPPSGVYGLRVLPLQIPPPDPQDIQALPSVPLFQETPGRWTQVLASTGPGPLDDSPAVHPVLGAGRHANVFLPVHGASSKEAGGKRWGGQVELTAVGSETPESSSDVELLETGANGLALRVRLPQVSPGAYRLRLRLSGKGGEEIRSAPLPVLVVKGDTPEQTLLWTDLQWQRPAPEPLPPPATKAAAAPPKASSPPRASKRLEKLATRYRQSLALLAQSDVSAARTALFQMESSALGRGRNPLGQLREAQERVQRELAAREVESLVPVLTLHLDLYRVYLRRKLHSLVGHGRTTVEGLAALYAAHGGDPHLAAEVLAALAFDLYQSGLLDLGQRRCKDALSYTLEHREALLGLALGLEKDGDYRGAATVLERLVKVAPTFGEARLRLAVNLARIGAGQRAEDLLTALVQDHPRGWVGTLAVEQLARLLLTNGQPDAALELLTTALASSPEQPGLRLLLAHLIDRRNQPREAFAVLAGIAPQPQRPTPMRRYDSWPTDLIKEMTVHLETAGRTRHPFLAEALQP